MLAKVHSGAVYGIDAYPPSLPPIEADPPKAEKLRRASPVEIL